MLLKSEREEANDAIVRKFREWRLTQKLSLFVAAAKLGCTKQYLSAIENSKKIPSENALNRMSYILLVDDRRKEKQALQENQVDVF